MDTLSNRYSPVELKGIGHVNDEYKDLSLFNKMLYDWIMSIDIEKQSGEEEFAFKATDGTKGPGEYAIDNAFSLYDEIRRGNLFYSCLRCVFKYGRGGTYLINRPFYYTYGLLYALLYADEELLEKQLPKFIKDLTKTLDTEHHEAFADLKKRLEQNKESRKFEAQMNATQEVTEGKITKNTFSQFVTEDNAIDYISSRGSNSDAEICINMFEALLPKPMHQAFRKKIEDRRDMRERERNERRHGAQQQNVNVQGDYVVKKEVQHEVAGVSAGGTGVNVTK